MEVLSLVTRGRKAGTGMCNLRALFREGTGNITGGKRAEKR